MLVTPFSPTLAQRFEAGIAGLALGCRAYEAHTHTSTDRFWQQLVHHITQLSHLDRPLPSPLDSAMVDLPDWSGLKYLPWLWLFLDDHPGQRDWLNQQPDPQIALLLQAFEHLSTLRPWGLPRELSPQHVAELNVAELNPFPTAQTVWQTALDLTARSFTLAQGWEHWQTDPLRPIAPGLKAIGIALWLTWRSDHVQMTLALAQQIAQAITPSNPQTHSLENLLPLAGLFGGFAAPPFPWSRISSLDRSVLIQHSDRLFCAWAGVNGNPRLQPHPASFHPVRE